MKIKLAGEGGLKATKLSMPCEMVVEGEGGRWWHGVDEVVVVRLRVRKYEAGEGQKARNRARLLDFGCAV